jgi:hypothetical protein
MMEQLVEQMQSLISLRYKLTYRTDKVWVGRLRDMCGTIRSDERESKIKITNEIIAIK